MNLDDGKNSMGWRRCVRGAALKSSLGFGDNIEKHKNTLNDLQLYCMQGRERERYNVYNLEGEYLVVFGSEGRVLMKVNVQIDKIL